jgi:hypothetical protein
LAPGSSVPEGIVKVERPERDERLLASAELKRAILSHFTGGKLTA